MWNVLDFIDSVDIRLCNSDTRFAPSEQAVLIAKCKTKPLAEKLGALQNLAD